MNIQMNIKTILLILVALLSLSVTSAATIPIYIDNVKIDEVSIQPNSNTLLDIERNQEMNVEVRLISSQFLDNVELQAFVGGFEYSDIAPVKDFTPIFSMSPNVLYVKKLTLKLSDLIDQDNYKLRLILSDRNNEQLVQEYSLTIDVPRHAVKIEDVLLTPENSVKAGSSLLARVRIGNRGQKTQEDVKVTVSLPSLGVSASTYLDKVENKDKEKQTEELFLQVPRCAKAGEYDLNIVAEFDELHRKTVQTKKVKVTESESCTESDAMPIVTFASNSANAKQGQQTAFTFTVTNPGKTKVVTWNVRTQEGVSVSLQPSASATLESQQTQTFTLLTNSETAGIKQIALSLSSGNNVLQQNTLSLNVSNSEGLLSGMLEMLLIALVVVLVVLGVILSFGKREKKKSTKKKVEEYY